MFCRGAGICFTKLWVFVLQRMWACLLAFVLHGWPEVPWSHIWILNILICCVINYWLWSCASNKASYDKVQVYSHIGSWFLPFAWRPCALAHLHLSSSLRRTAGLSSLWGSTATISLKLQLLTQLFILRQVKTLQYSKLVFQLSHLFSDFFKSDRCYIVLTENLFLILWTSSYALLCTCFSTRR